MRRLLAELLSHLRREGFDDPYEPLYEHPFENGGIGYEAFIPRTIPLILDARGWPEKVLLEILIGSPKGELIFEIRAFHKKRSLVESSSQGKGFSRKRQTKNYLYLISKPFSFPRKRDAYEFFIFSDSVYGKGTLLKLSILPETAVEKEDDDP